MEFLYKKNEEMLLNEIIEKVDASDLSSIKNITSGIVNIINNSDSTARDLKNIIELDPPLTAKVLSMANSAYFFSRNRINDIMEAVIWVGFTNLKELALSQKVCEVFQSNEKIYNYSRIQLWKHCAAVALLSKVIWQLVKGGEGEELYTCGLLHDIGIIVEDQLMRDEFKLILKKQDELKVNLYDSELLLWGCEHGKIGAAVVKNWKLPEEICEAISRHHGVFKSDEDYSSYGAVLYMADYLCHRHGIGFGCEYYPNKRKFNRLANKFGLTSEIIEKSLEYMDFELEKRRKLGVF